MNSMTGFGRGEARQGDRLWQVECASVNRKQLEVVVNLPRDLSTLEGEVRNRVSAVCSRGRVQVSIKRQESDASAGLPQISETAIEHYLARLFTLAGRLGISAEISISELLRLPGVLGAETEETDPAEAWPAIREALDAALGQWQRMRATEGSHLREEIEGRLATLDRLLADIAELAPQVPQLQRAALHQRLEQAGLPLPLDDERLVKEIALFADRTDLSEELARAASHQKQFRTYLGSGEPAGRSLDFLLQEFFREFNTMGSKCNHAGIAHAVVSAKTELEKIREQVQNLE